MRSGGPPAAREAETLRPRAALDGATRVCHAGSGFATEARRGFRRKSPPAGCWRRRTLPTRNREHAMLVSRFCNPRHLLGATRHSLAGLARAWQGEQAFRHEVGVLVMLLLALIATGKDVGDGLLVIGGWLGVMAVELLNSAVEEAFDLVSTEWNARIKAGKDMASAAIFVAMIINVGIWIRVFFLE